MKKIIKKIGVYALIFILIFNNIYIENIMLVNAETNLHEKIEKKDNQKKEKNIVLQIKDEYKNVLLGCANESIDYIFEGENIDKKDLIWTSSNDEIVQVNDGRILSNKEGSAVVTVSTKDEKISDNITINVTRNIENNVQSIANEDLTEVVFENGITYEINSSESFYINPVDYRFKYDIISYDSLGKILYSRINDSGQIYIHGGGIVKIRLRDEGNCKFSIPIKYKHFIKTNNNEIFYKITLLKEKGYEINNTTNNTIYMAKEYGYSYYKYITYRKKGNEKGGMDDININSSVYGNKEIRDSAIYRIEMNENTDFYIPYELKDEIDIKPLSNPILYEKEIKNKEVFALKNETAFSIQIINTSNYSEKTYDITKYDSNGKIIMSSSDTYGTIILNSGESFIINSSNGYPITFYTAYEAVSNEGPIIEAVKIKEIIWYDIINNEYRVDKSNKAVKKIKVDVNWNGKEAGEIMLKQGNNTISSTNGVFELVLGNNFNVNQDIYAVCKSKDGTYSNAKKLALKIVNSVIDLKDLTIPSTKLGSTISTTPILAANDFAYQFLPIKFITSFDEKTGTLKVIIGSQEAYSLKKFNKEYEKAKKAYNLGVAFGERTSYSLASKWKMDLITVGGYIEARVVNGDIKIIEGGININGKPNCAFGTQTFIGPVPVYASAKGVVDLGFSSKLLKDGLLNTGELKLTGDFNIGPNITPEVGVGIKGLNTGARGKLKLNAQATYNPLSTNFSVYGGIGLQATVLSKTYATEMISREWATKGKSSEVNLLELEEFDIFDTTKYSLMDRGYLNETSSWLSEGVSTISHDLVKSNEKIEILQNGVLPTTEPMLAKVGDKKVLVWLRDNEKRSSINRTEVVYSIYNEESGIWTLPQSIYDDGTADYYPNISFYGDDLFVVWQNTKKVMNDSSSIEEIAKESEIVVSKFNISNNKFDKPISITSNNVYDGVPEIITKDGKAYITWIRNSNNDIFGAKGNNSLMSSYFDGSKWASEKVLVKDVKGSSGVSMAYNNDEVYIIYDMDTDGNLETLEDKEIYYITSKGGRAKKLTNNKVIDSNPQFIENNKGLGIIWYSNGELLYSDTINKLEGKAVFKNEVYTGTDNFKVIQNNNSLAILWKENIDEIIEVYGALYDSKNNTLSEKIKITNTEERVKTVNALFNNDGDIQLVLNVSEKIPKEIDGFSYCDDGNSRLEVINIDLGYDIQIEENSLYVDDSEFKTNNPIEVSVKIKNNGQLAIDKVKVDFIEGNLSSGLTINNTEEITVNLKPGESKEISTKFIPKEAKNYNVQMKVTPVSGEDVYIKDNVVEFTCGYPDISIETLYASENIINIEIANKSSIPASNITLNIKEDSEDGKILKTIYIDSLYSDNSHIEKVKLDNNINYDNNGEALLYVEALTEEKYTYNNHSNIIISKQFDIEDINKDGKIDILDIALAANKYNLFIEDKEWDYKYDINLDGIIDIFDIILLSKKVS